MILQGCEDQEEVSKQFPLHLLCSFSFSAYRSHNGEILSLGWFGEEQEVSEEEHMNYHL